MRGTRLDPKKIYHYDGSVNRYHVDIAVGYYRDLYNQWDYAPFRNRDLDRGLMEHLEECSREIPLTAGLVIAFHLPAAIRDPVKEERSVAGLRNYFAYARLRAQSRRRRLYRSFVLYLIFGIVFLVTAYVVRTFLSGPFPASILPESFLIGGWVLFWEAFSIVFFRSRAVDERMRHLRRLLQAEIVYDYVDPAEADKR